MRLTALLLVSLATAMAIPATCFDNFGSCMDACPAPESGARCDTELNVPGLGGQPGYCCHEPEYGCYSEQGYALANCASKTVTKYDDFFYCCEPRVRATGKTVEIAPGVLMPSINLGTCCGSDPKVGIPAWLAAGGSGIDTSNDYASTTDIAGVLASTPRSAFFMTSKVHVPCPGGCSPEYALEQVQLAIRTLGVAQIDLMLIHHPASDAENVALWKGLEQAVALNLTRSIGLSNFNPPQIDALLKVATVRPSVNQCDLSVGGQDRQCGERDEAISYNLAHNISYEVMIATDYHPNGL